MRKILLALLLPLALVPLAAARGFEIDYFSPTGVTIGTSKGGDVFSITYGLWFDSHDFKEKEEEEQEYSHRMSYYSEKVEVEKTKSSTNVGPYIQFDWAILPFSIGGISAGFNVGAQLAALYSSEFGTEVAYAPMIGLQARYGAFDAILGWKGALYIVEAISTDVPIQIHHSFHLGLKYFVGKRGFTNDASSKGDSSSTGGANGGNGDSTGDTRILNGSHSYIRRVY